MISLRCEPSIAVVVEDIEATVMSRRTILEVPCLLGCGGKIAHVRQRRRLAAGFGLQAISRPSVSGKIERRVPALNAYPIASTGLLLNGAFVLASVGIGA